MIAGSAQKLISSFSFRSITPASVVRMVIKSFKMKKRNELIVLTVPTLKMLLVSSWHARCADAQNESPLMATWLKRRRKKRKRKRKKPNNLKKQSISNLQHNIRSLYNLSHATLRSTTNDQRPNQLFALRQLFFYSYDVDRTDEISYAIANIRLL